MRYLGGKNRISGKVAAYINSITNPGQAYWEPFVGAAWILSKVKAERRYASDLNRYLIQMWKALVNGWVPPENVSEEQYNTIKSSMEDFPACLVAFVGFSLSWGGKWFGGYARDDRGRSYARDGSRSLQGILGKIADVEFFAADFMDSDPPKNNMIIYCDPPYVGKTKYDYSPGFNHVAFWGRVRHLEELGHTVIVSEYQAPDDFTCVLEIRTRSEIRTIEGREQRMERLFALNPPEQRVRQLMMEF